MELCALGSKGGELQGGHARRSYFTVNDKR